MLPEHPVSRASHRVYGAPGRRFSQRSHRGLHDGRNIQQEIRNADRRQQDLRVPDFERHRRARCHRHRQALRPGRHVHLRPRLHLDRQLPVQDHLYRRRRRHPEISRLSDRAAGGKRRLPRDLLPAALRRTADHGAEGRFRQPRDPSHHGARADGPLLPGLPPRRPSDGDHGGGGRRAGRVLSRLHRHQRSAAAHDRLDPDDRQDADARRDGLQIHHRPALRVSEELARLRRELPAHVLRGAVRGLQDQSGAGRRAGQDLHPACRPRAERLDLDRAHRRLVRRQSVRLHRRRHRLPVGPGAWRRQRSGAEDARRDRHASTTFRNSSPR